MSFLIIYVLTTVISFFGMPVICTKFLQEYYDGVHSIKKDKKQPLDIIHVSMYAKSYTKVSEKYIVVSKGTVHQ